LVRFSTQNYVPPSKYKKYAYPIAYIHKKIVVIIDNIQDETELIIES